MNTFRTVSCTLVFSCFSAVAFTASADDEFLPTSAPIPMTPSRSSDMKTGVGFNVVTLKAEWKEDLLTANEEEIGDIDYVSRNLVFGIQKKKNPTTAVEYDLLLGILESESAQDTYFSPNLGKTANLDMSGDGWDIGARVIYSRCFHEQKHSDGTVFIEWIAGFSLHAALFTSDEQYFAETTDGSSMTEYDETIAGIFVRPAMAIQPVINVTDWLRLNPYAGLDARLTAYASEWEETNGRWSGMSWQQIISAGYDPEGSDTVSDISLGRALLGADVGIVVNRRLGHELKFGAVLSTILGGSSGDFTEAHILYSIEM